MTHENLCDKNLSQVIKGDNVHAGVRDSDETLYCHGKLNPKQSSLSFTEGSKLNAVTPVIQLAIT